MLKLIDGISSLDFLPADPFSAVITAMASTYGTDYGFARFYVQDNRAALSIVDGNVNIFASADADIDEIREFLNVVGYSSVRGEKGVIDRLGLDIADSSYIVEYAGKSVPAPAGFTDSREPREIYSLLTLSGFDMGDFNAFSQDVCIRLNKGTASFGGIAEDELYCCCFRLFEGSKSILLGAVATHPDFRGRGLASSLVPYMADSKKPSFLFTRNDALLDFYINCGFEEKGRWALSLSRDTLTEDSE